MSAFECGGGGSFPSAPVAGYEAWYDAADTGTLTIVSNKVSQWDDKSGNGHHVSQSTAGLRPLYDAAPRSVNGVVLPEFVQGSTTFLQSATLTMNDRTRSFFFALFPDEADTNSPISGGANNGCEIRLDANGQISVLKSGVAFLATFNAAGGNPLIAAIRLNATQIKLDLLGEQSFVVSDSTTFNAGTDVFNIGTDPSTTSSYDGLAGEIIVYGAELSDDDTTENLMYLVGQWLI